MPLQFFLTPEPFQVQTLCPTHSVVKRAKQGRRTRMNLQRAVIACAMPLCLGLFIDANSAVSFL